MSNFELQSLIYVTIFSSITDFESKFSFNLLSNANVLNVVLVHLTALTYCICFCLNYMGEKISFISFHYMFVETNIISTTKNTGGKAFVGCATRTEAPIDSRWQDLCIIYVYKMQNTRF
jgi:hypothetical protein